MTASYILTERRNELKGIIKDSFEDALLQSKAFALRVLGSALAKEVLCIESFDFSLALESIEYSGFPAMAYLGLGIGFHADVNLPQQVIDAFFSGLTRLQSREGDRLKDFASDDIAVLGVAEGISKLITAQYDNTNIASNQEWLLNVLKQYPSNSLWSGRVRALAGDLLDGRGRLRAKVEGNVMDKLALEICLRDVWAYTFRESAYPDQQERNVLLKQLLVEPAPQVGNLERAIIWLKALDLLVDKTVQALTPSLSDTVRILKSTQHSFKRWVWDEMTRRGKVDPAHWLIDNEPHVQSFLWAVLYPIYCGNLADEEYLPSYGQVQPRFDLAVTNLKLIIEVKIIRTKGDFAKIEEEVTGDLGLYFKEPDRFDRMVVYIYDDCDVYYPEQYEELRKSLKERERIEEVVIVRRPSMIPLRTQRKTS